MGERAEGARPLAVSVQVTGHVDIAPEDAGYSHEVRRHVLYYMSDENLRKDQFFQEVIAKNDGWLPMSTILGCARMKQMKATCEGVFAVVRDATDLIKLREGPPGREAIGRTTPPPPLIPKGGGKGQNFQPRVVAGNQQSAWVPPKPPSPPAPTPRPAVTLTTSARPPAAPALTSQSAPAEVEHSDARPSKDDRFYAGRVKMQMQDPDTMLIACDEISKIYGCDALFLPSAKPSSVSAGSLVVFTVPEDSEIGVAPQANFVAELAPLGSLGSQPSSGGVSSANRGGPGVQRTITKK